MPPVEIPDSTKRPGPNEFRSFILRRARRVHSPSTTAIIKAETCATRRIRMRHLRGAWAAHAFLRRLFLTRVHNGRNIECCERWVIVRGAGGLGGEARRRPDIARRSIDSHANRLTFDAMRPRSERRA